MRKVTTIVAAAAVALAFTACNKTTQGVDPEVEAGTFAMVSVIETEPRAVDIKDGQLNVSGVGGESEVRTGVLFSSKNPTELATNPMTFSPSTTPGVEKGWDTGVMAYQGPTGENLNAAVILNAPTQYTKDNFTADEKVTIDQLAKIAAKEGFTMSSVIRKDVKIEEGVKKAAVATGKNNLSFNVERVAAKVQASKATTVNTANSKLKGTFAGYRYSVAGSAKVAYVFADKAGERSLDKATATYKKFTSAIHNLAGTTFKTDNGARVVAKARDLQKVSDLKLVTSANDAKWASLNSLELKDDAKYNSASNGEGIFFLENSFNITPTDKDQLLYNDIVYVKFYAVYTPAKDEVIKSGTASKGYTYASTDEVAKNKVGDATGSFFVGTDTGKLYLTAAAAKADGNSFCKLYKGGKMYWRVPANQQTAGKDFTVYADTRRNNIYSVQVTDILGIGGNYDPIDPNDPNIPAPKPGDNPDEPKPDPRDPVDKKENNIKVQVSIMQWNLVHRAVKLEM